MRKYTLQSLTDLIKSCCEVKDNESLSERYAFEINVEKLENTLQSKGTNLHVISFGQPIESKLVGYEDMQLITEYVHNPKIFDAIFRNDTHVAKLMLFSTVNENGNIDLITTNEEGENIILSSAEIFNNCNTEVDDNFVKNVIRDLPCYNIIVTRSFNKKYDKFEYKVDIRSNFAMVAFQKSLKSNTEIEIVSE